MKTYDQANPESIEEFSQQIVGKTLRDFMTADELADLSQNRGSFGTAIEKYFFGIEPGGYQGPDFKEAGVELKTTGLKKVKTEWRAKERLVLGMINFDKVHSETFEGSSMLKKSSLMLIMYYIYQTTEKEIDFIDYVIKMSSLFRFPEEDLRIIKRDWELIVSKIREGRAHELSEGDTFYLGACTKGKDSSDKTSQPFSDVPAMRRAFSIKQQYLNVIINRHLEAAPVLSKAEIDTDTPFDALILGKFSPYTGKTVAQIHDMVGEGLNLKSKNYFSQMAIRMLGVKTPRALELEKAGVTVKTIRLKKNGTPKEAMSFPAFKYKEIVNQDWETSDFKSQLEKKFLLVIFQYNEAGNLVFKKAMFWNMPYSDLVEAGKVWDKTVKRLRVRDAINLPKSSETYNVHVRPHARNAQDAYETPWGEKVVKKCFWLNIAYIRDQIAGSDE